jgi:hypothetical protein
MEPKAQMSQRLLESSADLHDVRDFLGHANITTTSTYLASTPVRLARALDRLDPEPEPASNLRDRFAHYSHKRCASSGPAFSALARNSLI